MFFYHWYQLVGVLAILAKTFPNIAAAAAAAYKNINQTI